MVYYFQGLAETALKHLNQNIAPYVVLYSSGKEERGLVGSYDQRPSRELGGGIFRQYFVGGGGVRWGRVQTLQLIKEP